MLRYFPLAALVLAAPAMAQQAEQQNTPMSIIGNLGAQVAQQEVQLSIVNGTLANDAKAIALLQAELAAARKVTPVKPK